MYKRRFNHKDITGDFGYTICRSCGGWWEGPEDPANSPCEKEAQRIRSVRGHYEWLLSENRVEDAASYLFLCFKESSIGFTEDNKLKEVYWNEDGSTL